MWSSNVVQIRKYITFSPLSVVKRASNAETARKLTLVNTQTHTYKHALWHSTKGRDIVSISRWDKYFCPYMESVSIYHMEFD